MKVSESEVILIVVLVLIGFVLYTSGAMKTTGVKKVGGKHKLPEWFPPECKLQLESDGRMQDQCPCIDSSQCAENISICSFKPDRNLYKDYPGYGYCKAIQTY